MRHKCVTRASRAHTACDRSGASKLASAIGRAGLLGVTNTVSATATELHLVRAAIVVVVTLIVALACLAGVVRTALRAGDHRAVVGTTRSVLEISVTHAVTAGGTDAAVTRTVLAILHQVAQTVGADVHSASRDFPVACSQAVADIIDAEATRVPRLTTNVVKQGLVAELALAAVFGAASAILAKFTKSVTA